MTGRGKLLFRELSKIVTEQYRRVKSDFEEGYYYSYDELYELKLFLVEEFRNRFVDEQAPNMDLWLDRLYDLIDDKFGILIEVYGVDTKNYDDDDDTDDDLDDTYAGNTILGFPVVDKELKKYLEMAGYERRNRILPSIPDLEQYLEELPQDYVGGIEIILNVNNEIIGYVIWIQS